MEIAFLLAKQSWWPLFCQYGCNDLIPTTDKMDLRQR
jgi:hypothetical protein